MKRSKHLTLVGILCLGVFLLCRCTQSEPASRKSTQNELFKAYAGKKPQLLSSIRPNFLGEFGAHAHALDGLSLAAQQAALEELSNLAKELKPEQGQDLHSQIQQEAEAWFIDQKLKEKDFLLFKDPLNPLNGFHPSLMESLTLQMIQTKEDTEAYNARLDWIPRQIRELSAWLQARGKAGISSHPLIIKRAKAQVKKFVETPVNQHPIYRSLAIKLNGVKPTEMNLYEASDYLGVCSQKLEKIVIPAYEKLLVLLEEMDAQAGKSPQKTSSFPAYYSWKLNFYNAKDIDPDQYFEKGLQELDSLKQLIAALDEAIKKEGAQRKEPETPKRTKLEEVQIFTGRMRNARQQFIGLFDSLPHKSPEVMHLPKQFEQNIPLVYLPPSWDKQRAARIVVNFELWDKANAYEQNSLLFKKLYPGLHSYYSLGEAKNSFLKAEAFPAWIGGWEEYCMRLANNPLYLFYEKNTWHRAYQIGRLEILLAMLVDIGIHHKNWSDQESKKFMQAHTQLTEYEQEQLLLFAHSDPGLLTTHWIGAAAFQSLYRLALEQPPGKFNYKTFHQLCFKHGPLPWFLAQRLIKA